jgi:ubiquinone/menaquinone biosynthesis C-methylase UbiE
MKDYDPRKQYWNETYAEYWRERVAEAGVGDSRIVGGDKRTSSDDVWSGLINDTEFQKGNILDVGCGWGRFFQMYIDKGLTVSAVDISIAMVQAAAEEWRGHSGISSIQEATAEDLPFESEMFSNLICIGTFDATYQEKAMNEFLRVTKPGGLIYFSGKNTNYHFDDEAAHAAEVGARSKGHPNYFTRTYELITDLEKHGHRVAKSYYFERRGDLADMNFQKFMPNRFYEYFIVVKRGDDAGSGSVCAYYDKYSEAFEYHSNDKG